MRRSREKRKKIEISLINQLVLLGGLRWISLENDRKVWKYAYRNWEIAK